MAHHPWVCRIRLILALRYVVDQALSGASPCLGVRCACMWVSETPLCAGVRFSGFIASLHTVRRPSSACACMVWYWAICAFQLGRCLSIRLYINIHMHVYIHAYKCILHASRTLRVSCIYFLTVPVYQRYQLLYIRAASVAFNFYEWILLLPLPANDIGQAHLVIISMMIIMSGLRLVLFLPRPLRQL